MSISERVAVCENEKSQEFELKLKDYQVDISAFIKLHNMWSEMNPKERGECIENIVRNRM